MKTINVLPNQTIIDIAVQYYGTLDAVKDILRLNPAIRIDPSEIITSGQDDLSAFYFDLKLNAPQTLAIDDASSLINKNTLKKINKPVTTYDYGTLDTDD